MKTLYFSTAEYKLVAAYHYTYEALSVSRPAQEQISLAKNLRAALEPLSEESRAAFLEAIERLENNREEFCVRIARDDRPR